jgi:hypothetical protein
MCLRILKPNFSERACNDGGLAIYRRDADLSVRIWLTASRCHLRHAEAISDLRRDRLPLIDALSPATRKRAIALK